MSVHSQYARVEGRHICRDYRGMVPSDKCCFSDCNTLQYPGDIPEASVLITAWGNQYHHCWYNSCFPMGNRDMYCIMIFMVVLLWPYSENVHVSVLLVALFLSVWPWNSVCVQMTTQESSFRCSKANETQTTSTQTICTYVKTLPAICSWTWCNPHTLLPLPPPSSPPLPCRATTAKNASLLLKVSCLVARAELLHCFSLCILCVVI